MNNCINFFVKVITKDFTIGLTEKNEIKLLALNSFPGIVDQSPGLSRIENCRPKSRAFQD